MRTRTKAPFSSGFGNLTVLKSGSGTLDCSSTTAKCFSVENPNDSIARRVKGSPTPCMAVYVNSRDECAFILKSRVAGEHSANRAGGRRRQNALLSTRQFSSHSYILLDHLFCSIPLGLVRGRIFLPSLFVNLEGFLNLRSYAVVVRRDDLNCI